MGSDQLFKKKKFRESEELARKKAKRAPYEVNMIICEDTKSALNYFKELRNYFRLNHENVILIPSKGSAPISIVEHAIELGETTPSIDRIFCVFDRDDHESYNRAIKKIKNHSAKQTDKNKPKYQVITSTPCFELWLLLHFGFTTKSYMSSGKKSAAENLINDLLKKLPSYNKNTTEWFHSIINNMSSAIKCAKRLIIHNKDTNSNNPGTNMHELIEHLMNLKGHL